ncbi:hypothetical protein [Streptomyces sp. NPDC014894]|uniref:hypothetical protein n=1 Tax=unclassified Streptomyces TaxID=2593676 RepID=UPI0036FF1AC9
MAAAPVVALLAGAVLHGPAAADGPAARGGGAGAGAGAERLWLLGGLALSLAAAAVVAFAAARGRRHE